MSPKETGESSSLLVGTEFISFLRQDKVFAEKRFHFFDCKKMEVSFQTDDARTKVGDAYYEEWMLWCLAEPIEIDAQAEYFVSRASHPNHVFTYARDFETSEMYLENLSTGISVVVD